jgi:hypothetical protein
MWRETLLPLAAWLDTRGQLWQGRLTSQERSWQPRWCHRTFVAASLCTCLCRHGPACTSAGAPLPLTAFGTPQIERHCLRVSVRTGVKGPMYHFNPEEGPKAVFERFFGTNNPYEALESEQGGGRGICHNSYVC